MTTTGVHNETTLKARHQEALDIYHAWVDRHRNTGGQQAKAVEIQMNEAWDWVQQTAIDLQLFRQITRQHATQARQSAQNTPGRLHAHRTH